MDLKNATLPAAESLLHRPVQLISESLMSPAHVDALASKAETMKCEPYTYINRMVDLVMQFTGMEDRAEAERFYLNDLSLRIAEQLRTRATIKRSVDKLRK